MRCWNCGNQISRDMQYCEFCGADMEKTQKYSQSEIEDTIREQKGDKTSEGNGERPLKNRINLEYEKKEAQNIQKKPIAHGNIIHKRRIKKPAYDILLWLALAICILYIIVMVISHGKLLEKDLTDNPFLSHILGMLAAVILTAYGIYVRQDGFLLAGSVIFTVSPLFYLPGAWCGWICAAVCFAGYHMHIERRRKLLRKKSVDSGTK